MPLRHRAQASSSVGRITPSGEITEFPPRLFGERMAAGWHHLWARWGSLVHRELRERYRSDLERRFAHGSYPVPTPNSWPADITQGPDGNLWFSEVTADRRISFAPITWPLPSVSSFSPASGPVGTSVTILGANFVGATSVTFSGVVQPSFTVDPTGTVITAAVPPGAATGLIQVTTPAERHRASGASASPEMKEFTNGTSRCRCGGIWSPGNLVVSDGYTACLQDMHVKIQRRFSDHWRTIATDVTDADGSFIHRLSDRTGWYRARVNDVTLGSGDVCNDAISGTRHHRRRS